MSRLTFSVDWGGTELKGACCGAAGLLRDFRFPSVNLRVIDADRLSHICHTLSATAGALAGESHLWLIGAAGADDLAAAERLRKALMTADGTAEGVEIYSDYACNHAACLGGSDGILSINGTGSVLYATNEAKSLRNGGWGYLLDSAPSGSYFGRCATEGVLRHLEGEPGYEAFATSWQARFSEPDRRRIIDELYRGGSIQQRLGICAPVLTDAFEAGNQAATAMVNDSIKKLAVSLQHLMRQMCMSRANASGSGGLWAGWAPFAGLVENACRQHDLSIKWQPRAFPLYFGPLILHAKTDYASADLLKLLQNGVNR